MGDAFNWFRGEGVRPFQGRYKALHAEPGRALAPVAHYIHLNPIRAKIVPEERLVGGEATRDYRKKPNGVMS